jgi:hypothetical protein
MECLLTWCLFAQNLPEVPGDKNKLVLYGGIGAGVLVLLLLLFLLFRKGKPRVDPEAGLAEDLATYPPAPRTTGARLLVVNQPGRLRLVVLAPVGKRAVAQDGEVEGVLEQVLRGLGEVAAGDKPRVRVWPPQLSSTGFAPTFLRLTRRPDPEGQPSRWVLLAGPARAGAQPVLLGLAVHLEAPSKLGKMILDETQWPEALRIQ